MFEINDVQWYIKLVPPIDEALYRDDGSLTIGMCDRDTQTIYINITLRGRKLKKVLCHELVHAAMFSYGIQLNVDQEEVIADIIATYGEEIINITNTLFKKLKGESY